MKPPSEHMFEYETPRPRPGRVRLGLDREVSAARAAGYDLSASGVATLRTLADQIDQLERMLRSPAARPYDRIPLTGLVRQFDDTWSRVFAVRNAAADPLAAALAQFIEQDGAPEAGDTAGPLAAD
jgi:hypothetical protein